MSSASSASPPTGPVPVAGRERGWWPLAVIASAHLMAILDTTVMFVALPSAQRALGLSVASRQWVVSAYTLALAGLLLPAGRLADRLGARRTLLTGVAGFTLASAAGGAAVGGAMLIAARGAQGAFAALLVSSTKSLLITVYTGEGQRARAIGVFAATLTAGMAAGLILGGVLTTGPGWRWCLYANVALSLPALIAAPRILPGVPGRRNVRIDLASALLVAAGMTARVYGLGETSSAGWASGQIAGSLAVAAVLLGGFAARQAGRAGRLLPLAVLAERNRGGGYIALIVNALSTFGMMLVLTYQLQSVMAWTPLRAGLALIPFALATAAGSALIAPPLARRVPARWLVTGGVVTEAAGLIPLIWLTPASRYLPLILAATIIEGLATGIAGPAALATALRAVPASDSGAAGAATSAASQLGSSVGAALLNTIAATTTATYLASTATASTATATARGFAMAMFWGAVILAIAAIPIAILINARPQGNRS